MTVLRSGSATDMGRVRQSNQDVALEETDLFAVADGMGGHVGGEVAARVAVDTLRESFRGDPSVEGLRRAVAQANDAVWRRSQDQTGLRGMGTTLTATALVTEREGRKVIALANVGDSRAYVFTRGRVIQVTADHSLAEEKVRQGELTEAEAAIHPHRHILTRALGVASAVDVDLWELHLHEGDRVLLCSDGLTNEVNDERIAEALGSIADPTEAAQALVDAAVEHGGNDNVTVVVVDVLSADERLVSSTGTRRYRSGRVPRADGSPSTSGVASAAGAASDAGAGVPDGAAGERRGGADGRTATATTERPRGTTGAGAGRAADPGLDRDGPPSAALADDHPTPEPYRPALGEVALARQRSAQRRQRRAQRHATRWLTVRFVLFLLLVAAVVAAGFAFLRWYGYDTWYVTLDGDHLAIYQGHPGGFLWYRPKLVKVSSVTTASILPTRLPTLRHDRIEPTKADATRYVNNLYQEYVSTQQLRNGSATSPTSTTPTTTPTSTPTSSPTSTTLPVGGK